MVDEVLTHTRQVLADVDAESLQILLGADARAQQDGRRVECPGGQTTVRAVTG